MRAKARVKNTDTISSPSALSFLPMIGTSLPISRRSVTALPRTIRMVLPRKEAPPDHVRAFARNIARASARVLLRPRSHTTAFGDSHSMNANRYFHMVDKPCTELPNPEAAVLPALVSVFDSEVTSLGPMMTRSAWVCAVFRQAILSSHACMTDFPPTKPEARGTNPTRIFTVRHRLFKVLLASALLRIRLRLSWLSFSRSSF